MARKLGEMLTADGLISETQLSQGLQAQNQHGGRLGSNLVELGFVTEQQLAAALSRQLRVDCIQADQVASIPPAVIEKIPKDLAEKYRVVPFALVGRVLQVCMSDPRDLEKVDELAFRLNCSIKPFVATEVALEFAQQRYYGLPGRTQRPRLAIATSPATFIALADDTESPRRGTERVDRAEFLRVGPDEVVDIARRKPLPIPELSDELANVRSMDEIITYLGQFMTVVFSRGVLLALRDGHAVGVATLGSSLSSARALQIRVPITEGSLLHQVLLDIKVVHRKLIDDQPLAAICAAAGLEPELLTVMPILEDRRVELIAIGQGVTADRLKELFPRIRRFLARVSCALQIITLRQQILATKETESA
ncbi:MAG: hypothetical protein V3T05_08835 [Myxococcota bacterium]